MVNNYIIALLGCSQVGKDEVAKTFIYNGYKQYAFGDAVKKEYASINDLPLEEMYNEKKNFHRPGIILLGETKRKNKSNYWVKEISDLINFDYTIGYDIIISDLRRIPEIDYICELKKEYGDKNVILIHVERPKKNNGIFDEDKETHKAINYAKFHNYIDLSIVNADSPEELDKVVNNIIKYVIKIN